MSKAAWFVTGITVGVALHRRAMHIPASKTGLMIKRHFKIAILNITHEILQDSLRPDSAAAENARRRATITNR